MDGRNRQSIKIHRERVIWFIVPGLIVLGMFLAAYICKGIWPFGNARVEYFDNMQQVAPIYSHLWDVMHGRETLMFDPYTGLGTSLSMTVSAFSMLSPFNLILYCFPRELVSESIGVLNIAKSVFAACAMYLFLRYIFPRLSSGAKTTYSVMYGMCGFAAMYAPVFTPWMDIMAIFPLVVWGLLRLLKDGRKPFFIIMIAIMFLINYYQAAMIMVFCLFFAGLYIIFETQKGRKLKNSLSMVVSAVLGVGMAAFILLPVYRQLSHSQRSDESPGLFSEYGSILLKSVFSTGALDALQRFMMLAGCGFAVAVVIYGLVRARKRKENDAWFFTLLTIIGILPVLVQGTNLVWHLGSYYGYSLRMGYITAFILIFVAARYSHDNNTVRSVSYADGSKSPDACTEAEKIRDERKIRRINLLSAQKGKLSVWPGIIAGAAAAVAYVIVCRFIPKHSEGTALIVFASIIGGVSAFYLLMIFLKRKERAGFIRVTAVLPCVLAELFIVMYSFLGVPAFLYTTPYQTGDYVQEANSALGSLEIESSATERIKNPDLSLNANYPLILRRGALSSFTAAMSEGVKKDSARMGYSQYFWWMLDTGGTVFSDALMHVTSVIGSNEVPVDPALAVPVRTSGAYTLYAMNYSLPYAMTISGDAFEVLQKELAARGRVLENKDFANDWIHFQNAFYKAVSQDSEPLITVPGLEGDVPEGTFSKWDNNINVKTKPGTKTALYMAVRDEKYPEQDILNTRLDKNVKIYVDGKPVEFPDFGDLHNKKGLTDYNNNLIYLGTYSGETLDLRIAFRKTSAAKEAIFSIGQLDLDKLGALAEAKANEICTAVQDKNNLELELNNSYNEGKVLIPVVYTPDMHISVNGEMREVSEDMRLAGLFTAVDVPAGKNSVKIKWIPEGLKTGTAVSLAALGLFIILWIVTKGRERNVPYGIRLAGGIIFFAAFAAGVIFVLAVPAAMAVPAIVTDFLSGNQK